jgi:regulator of ribonuclease activity B
MKLGLVIVGVAVVLIGLWIVRRTGSAATRISTIPDDPDGRVLKQLVAAGSDLSKPHNAEFFLYFPDEDRASKAFRQLAAEGYTGKVERGAGESSWLCFVTKPIVPSHATMISIRDRMSELANAGGGEYDGWGTPISR